MDAILAKSSTGDRQVTLLQHTHDVMDAAATLFGEEKQITRLGRCWLRFFKLPEDCWSKFQANLLAACALHDWGKANDGFQAAVRRRGEQAIRHEHFSAILTGMPVVQNWLSQKMEHDHPLILSAVLTHHLKAGSDVSKQHGFGNIKNDDGVFYSLHNQPEFRSLIEGIEKRTGLNGLDLSSIPSKWFLKRNWRVERDRIKDEILHPFSLKLRCDPSRKQVLLAVRTALIAADAAGSGLVREGHTISQWISHHFSERNLWNDQDIETKVIAPRIKQLEGTEKKKKFEWTDFQNECADLPDRALLLAPCGSGKTLAAWRWIQARLKEKPIGHVLFLYPTRATATEGFRDYVSWAPEAEAALMHGTSAFDLEGMFSNDGDRQNRDYEADRRLFSLGFWPRRVFSATVDQFLAFMNYGYGPICMLPVLADSVIVIDEVHSFDQNMFSALKSFLNTFNVPVLCMTATLIKSRQQDLIENCKLHLYDKRPGELQKIADAPRYRIKEVRDKETAKIMVQNALKQGKRVLWVVNQVKRAQAIAREFVDFDLANNTGNLFTREGIPVFCYHSRFRLKDRAKRHAEVVRSLKANQTAALGITTQVCEMSLDIDVDLLVTEYCPVSSLIQRMGRCNRARDPRSLYISGEVIIYKTEDIKPYDENALRGLEDFLKEGKGRDLSQADLETIMSKCKYPNSDGDKLSSFLESGSYAVSNDSDAERFRDIENYTRPCILDSDIDQYNRSTSAEKPGFILPVTLRDARSRDPEKAEHRKLPRYLRVSSGQHYYEAIGFYKDSLIHQEGEC